MSLRAALSRMVGTIPGAVAAGVVDTRTGEVVAAGEEQMLDGAATLAAEVLGGADARAVAGILGGDGFSEVVVRGDDRVAVLRRCGRDGSRAIVAVCRATAPMGRVLTETRFACVTVEAVE